jgi:Suppressor of fused protein (SUFU)
MSWSNGGTNKMSDESKGKVVSMSGAPIYNHSASSEWQAPQGEMCIEQISEHLEAHLGKIETVFHEIISDTVHIDVHVIQPTEEFPFWRLVTSGMSDLPMTTPENADVPQYIELMITLPGDWKIDQASFEDETWYWPVRLIKGLAQLPHKYNTWLGWGHTVPNGDPSEQYAGNTKLSGAIILPSITVPDDLHTLKIDDTKEIQFFAVVPLYEEEMNLKLRSGSDALLDKLGDAGVSDIVDPFRKNTARKRFGLF